MKSWKDRLQLGDLEPDQRMEMTCKRCGHVHYLTADAVLKAGGRATLYLSQVESRAVCKARGCRGPVRMALPRKGDTSGFVGGMA